MRCGRGVIDLGGWTAQCYKARLAGSVWRVGASYKGLAFSNRENFEHGLAYIRTVQQAVSSGHLRRVDALHPAHSITLSAGLFGHTSENNHSLGGRSLKYFAIDMKRPLHRYCPYMFSVIPVITGQPTVYIDRCAKASCLSLSRAEKRCFWSLPRKQIM